MPSGELESLIRTGFSLVNQRIEDQCDRSEERHTEILRRLEAIDSDVSALRTTTQKNEVAIHGHSRDIKTLFDRLRQRVQVQAQPRKTWMALGIGIGAGVVWAFKLWMG